MLSSFSKRIFSFLLDLDCVWLTLKIMFGWRLCLAEDYARLKIMFGWRLCSAEDYAWLKIMLGWRLCLWLKIMLGWRLCLWLKIMLGWRLCLAEDYAWLKIMFGWRLCSAEDYVRLKIILLHMKASHNIMHSGCCLINVYQSKIRIFYPTLSKLQIKYQTVSLKSEHMYIRSVMRNIYQKIWSWRFYLRKKLKMAQQKISGNSTIAKIENLLLRKIK